jgi:hypothetical protein
MACKTIKTLTFNDRAFVGAALAAFKFGASICGEAPHAQGRDRTNLANEGMADIFPRRAGHGFEGAS